MRIHFPKRGFHIAKTGHAESGKAAYSKPDTWKWLYSDKETTLKNMALESAAIGKSG